MKHMNRTCALSLVGLFITTSAFCAFPQWQGADFNGDGKIQPALYDANGLWLMKSSSSAFERFQFGATSFRPFVGDFDGNGQLDVAVYDPATAHWYIRRSNGTVLAWALQWGFRGGIPLVGDFNGDGRTDLVIYDPATGKWYIREVTGGVLAWGVQHGFKGALPAVGDYDGDRKDDLAVYTPANGKW